MYSCSFQKLIAATSATATACEAEISVNSRYFETVLFEYLVCTNVYERLKSRYFREIVSLRLDDIHHMQIGLYIINNH